MAVLGTGTYDIQLYDRGGTNFITHLDRIDSIDFSRKLDDTSDATVKCVTDEWADLIHPWHHELHIYRNRQRVWLGPVRDKTYMEGGRTTIECRDLFSWMDFRVPHDELDFSDVDMADIFAAIVTSALKPDPTPNITIDKKATGTQIDYYFDPEVPKIAANDLRDLADSGVDFTVLGRTLYVRGEEMDPEPLGTMYEHHFSKMPEIKESGEMGTLLLLTGSGGDYHSHPDDQLSVEQWAKHPFGLLEQVIDATTMFDSDDKAALEKAAKARYELTKEPRLFIKNAELDKTAPVGMNDLVPGRRFDLRMQVGSIPLITQYRLQSLSVLVEGYSSETVSVELTSVGDVSKDAKL